MLAAPSARFAKFSWPGWVFKHHSRAVKEFMQFHSMMVVSAEYDVANDATHYVVHSPMIPTMLVGAEIPEWKLDFRATSDGEIFAPRGILNIRITQPGMHPGPFAPFGFSKSQLARESSSGVEGVAKSGPIRRRVSLG